MILPNRILIAVLVYFAAVLAAYTCVADEPRTELVPVENLTGFIPENPNGTWSLTKPADHHNAAVRVSTPDGAGTGMVVELEEGKGMLVVTNWHVVERGRAIDGRTNGVHSSAIIQVQDGKDGVLPVIWTSQRYDVAVLYSEKGKAGRGFPIAGYEVPIGATMEMCGYGGPHHQIRRGLRTFTAKRIRHEWDVMALSAPTVSGDSGGPMLHNGAIYGVNYGSSGGRSLGAINNEGGPWRLNYPACSKITGPKLAEVLTSVCRPFGCRPRVIRRPCPPAGCPPQNPPLEPPANSPSEGDPPYGYNPPPYNPPSYNPPPYNPPPYGGKKPTTEEIDYDMIVDAIKDDPRFKGPKGDTGPQGIPGMGFTSLELNSNNDVIVVYSDGRRSVIGNLTPKDTSSGPAYFSIVPKRN